MSENQDTPAEAAIDAAAPDGQAAAPAKTVEDLEAELAQTKDQMLRALADTENRRRRLEKEVVDARAYAIDKFARDLLSVADNLGRALGAVSDEQRAVADEGVRNMLDGVAMTEQSLLEVFAKHGLKRVGAAGEKFDPNLHQAVAQIPSAAPAGAIAEVFQAGFVLGDRTLRAAMVAVSLGGGPTAAPAPAAPPAAEDPGGSVDIKV